MVRKQRRQLATRVSGEHLALVNKDIYMTWYVLSLDRSAILRNFLSTLQVSAYYGTTDDTIHTSVTAEGTSHSVQ